MAQSRRPTNPRGRPASNRDLVSTERWLLSEEVASYVRHELRNKLTSAKAALFLLRRRLRQSAAALEAAGRRPGAAPAPPGAPAAIDGASGAAVPEQKSADALCDVLGLEVERMNEILRTVPPLSMERRLRTVSARACLEQAVRCAGVPSGVEVDVSTDPPDVEVEVDPAEVVVAVRCLIENAAEALPAGGSVRLQARASGGSLEIEIDDGGPGIPEQLRSDVMRPFYTTKRGHAGLGLKLAQRVAERYGGALTLKGGARMGLVLPGTVARAGGPHAAKRRGGGRSSES